MKLLNSEHSINKNNFYLLFTYYNRKYFYLKFDISQKNKVNIINKNKLKVIRKNIYLQK